VGNECDGQLILTPQITNNPIGNIGYLWNDGSQASQLTVNSTGTYSVTILDQGTGCSSSRSIDVDVFNQISVFLNSEPNCDNNSEVFLSAISNITEDVTFQWTDPTNNILPNTTAEIPVQNSGDYMVKVAGINNSCLDSANINVLLIPILPEELILPTSALFCSQDPDINNTSVTLDPGFFSIYEWRLKNDDIVLSGDRLYTIADQGVYEVTLSNGLTCIRDEVIVRDDCSPKIEAPNAFTPENSDGLNDFFFVFPNIYVTNFEIFIYSRQGELVYRSNDINFRWNGIFRGSFLQIGTYAYVMRFNSTLSPGRGVIEQHGGVVLLR
ncbi:MAG: gliding motility-associated-like protein, partial [Saprospiraceae bacterium]